MKNTHPKTDGTNSQKLRLAKNRVGALVQPLTKNAKVSVTLSQAVVEKPVLLKIPEVRTTGERNKYTCPLGTETILH